MQAVERVPGLHAAVDDVVHVNVVQREEEAAIGLVVVGDGSSKTRVAFLPSFIGLFLQSQHCNRLQITTQQMNLGVGTFILVSKRQYKQYKNLCDYDRFKTLDLWEVIIHNSQTPNYVRVHLSFVFSYVGWCRICTAGLS